MREVGTGPRAVLAVPAFRRWLVAAVINLLGSAISAVVLPILVFRQTGSASQTATLAAIEVAPYLLVGLIAGPLADKYDRRRLIVSMTVLQGVAMAAIPLASSGGSVSLWVVYAAALASSTLFVFGDAAVFGAIPTLVPPAQLAAANGLLASAQAGAAVAGPAVGGLLAAAVGPVGAIWVDVASFLVAGAVIATVPGRFRSEPRAGGGMLSQIREGLSFIRRHRVIRALIVVGFGNSLATGVVIGLLVVYAAEQLGEAGSSGRIGLLYACSGLGSLLAGLAFSRLYAPRRVAWLTPLTLALSSLLVAGHTLTTRFAVAAVLQAAYAASSATTITVGITYRMSATPDHLRSRVNVVGRMVAWGGQPVGAALGGLFADRVGVVDAYAAAAVLLAGTAAAATLWLARASPRSSSS